MKTAQILKAFNVKGNKWDRQSAGYLSKIFEVLTEIKPDILTATSTNNGEFMEFDGVKMKANTVKVITHKSDYSFPVPIDNDFYNAICDLVGIPYALQPVIEPCRNKLNTILIDVEVLGAIKKALRFVGKDAFRPAMTCVCLSFTDKCEVVGTNSHYLFMSELFGYVAEKPIDELLLPADLCKAIAAIKPSNDMPILIDIYEGGEATFEGIKFEIFDEYHKYPNYKCVIPKFHTSMRFDRKLMLSSIAKVVKYANKSTNQVNFHLNGKIELMAQDVDFDFQGQSEMPYISKTFEDLDIAFNGNMLAESLKIFKANEIEMFNNGCSTKQSIFTDGKDRVLLMPLCV